MIQNGPGLRRLRRVGEITVLAVEAHEKAMISLAPEGEDRVIIARDGNNNSSHELNPFDRSNLSNFRDFVHS